MRAKWSPAFFLLIALASLPGRAQQSAAQAPAPRAAQKASVETDVGGSFYKTFTNTTTANGVQQTPANADGGMFELRQIRNPLVGYELTFGYNEADEKFAATATNCGYVCNAPPQSLTSKASTVGLDWVFSKQFGHLRPFAVGGLGFFIDEPGVTTYPNRDIVHADFIYGGGIDWAFTPHLGLRFQYRSNNYSAPNLTTVFPASGAMAHMNEPMAGVFYAF